MKRLFQVTLLFTFLLLLPGLPTALAQSLSDGPRIAGPTGFQAVLIAESTLELSWDETLPSGSEVTLFKVYDRGSQIAQVQENRLELTGISRDVMYDFSVTAVTTDGVETRRSERVYIDLPPLSGVADGGNAAFPPLENLQAEIIDSSSARLSWAPARSFWAPAEPAPHSFEYWIWIDQTLVGTTTETSWTHDGFSVDAVTQVAVTVRLSDRISSRQMNFVAVDLRQPAGTVIAGAPGFTSVKNLRSTVYSPSAAELFWEETQSPGTFHIFVDGRLVARTRGRSHFLDDLPPGSRVRLSVADAFPYEDNGSDGLLTDAWIQTPTGEPEINNNPIAVTGLRAEVYSSTATELFWDRSATVFARYKVYLDGTLAADTDGTSWFGDRFSPGAETRATVTAYGPNALETAPSEIRFYNPDLLGNSVCEVRHLRAVIYSTTAAELFWDRDPSGPGYELFMDGTQAGTTRGTSWFLSDLAPGSAHEVRISVLDAACDRVSASVEFELPAL
jgi:hypothetical protein